MLKEEWKNLICIFSFVLEIIYNSSFISQKENLERENFIAGVKKKLPAKLPSLFSSYNTQLSIIAHNRPHCGFFSTCHQGWGAANLLKLNEKIKR